MWREFGEGWAVGKREDKNEGRSLGVLMSPVSRADL